MRLAAFLLTVLILSAASAETGPTPAERQAQLIKKRQEFEAILAETQFHDWKFRLGDMGDGFFLQVRFTEKNSVTGKEVEQGGRKWYVSSYSVPNEIVQTALKAVITAAEHETRENFTVNGHAVVGPHFNHDAWAKTLEKVGTRQPVPPVPTVDRVIATLKGIKYRDWTLQTGEMSLQGEKGAYYRFVPPGGEPLAAVRYLPPTATDEEIVHSTFSAVQEEEGARIKNEFSYRKKALFSRKANCLGLMLELIGQNQFDTRH